MEATIDELSDAFKAQLGQIAPILSEIIYNYRPETLDIDIEFIHDRTYVSIPLQVPKTLIDLVKKNAFEKNSIFSKSRVRNALQGFEEHRGIWTTSLGCTIFLEKGGWWVIKSKKIGGWKARLIFQTGGFTVSLSVKREETLSSYLLERYDMKAFLTGNYYLSHSPIMTSFRMYFIAKNLKGGIEADVFDRKIIPRLHISRIFG